MLNAELTSKNKVGDANATRGGKFATVLTRDTSERNRWTRSNRIALKRAIVVTSG